MAVWPYINPSMDTEDMKKQFMHHNQTLNELLEDIDTTAFIIEAYPLIDIKDEIAIRRLRERREKETEKLMSRFKKTQWYAELERVCPSIGTSTTIKAYRLHDTINIQISPMSVYHYRTSKLDAKDINNPYGNMLSITVVIYNEKYYLREAFGYGVDVIKLDPNATNPSLIYKTSLYKDVGMPLNWSLYFDVNTKILTDQSHKTYDYCLFHIDMSDVFDDLTMTAKAYADKQRKLELLRIREEIVKEERENIRQQLLRGEFSQLLYESSISGNPLVDRSLSGNPLVGTPFAFSGTSSLPPLPGRSDFPPDYVAPVDPKHSEVV